MRPKSRLKRCLDFLNKFLTVVEILKVSGKIVLALIEISALGFMLFHVLA